MADFTGVHQDGCEQSLSLNPTKISGLCGRLMLPEVRAGLQEQVVVKRMPVGAKEVATPTARLSLTVPLREYVKVRITRRTKPWTSASIPPGGVLAGQARRPVPRALRKIGT